jgi:RNA ligase (TIGR02306 family)
MTKLATIEKIHSVQPHFNADALEVAKIKEWPVVVKKGEYKDGDLVVFIRIDSIVPSTNSYFAFLEKQKYRVWNAKFRKAPSQGLVCPLSILPDYGINSRSEKPMYSFTNVDGVLGIVAEEGNDVTEILGVIKYEKPIDVSAAGDAKGSFPTHLVSITDEDNLLNYPEVLDELRGELCYLTVKADGSSMTTIHNNGEVNVCSRRLEQKEGTGFWVIADSYGLPDKLKAQTLNLAIQAEACGGKIQGNPLGLNKPSMFVFNIKDISTGKWYGWEDIKATCALFGIPTVQLVCEPFVFDDTWTIARLQELANKVTYTASSGEVRKGEGIVLRPVTPKYSPAIGRALSVKILNQDY